MIYNIVLNYIYNTHGHRISQWNHTILDPVSLERYAEAVYDKGATLDNCIGFIGFSARYRLHLLSQSVRLVPFQLLSYHFRFNFLFLLFSAYFSTLLKEGCNDLGLPACQL